MSKRSIYTQKFVQAILGEKDLVFIGDFVINKLSSGIQVLTKQAYEDKLEYDKNKTLETRNALKGKQKADKKNLKVWQPRSIREDDFPEWMRGWNWFHFFNSSVVCAGEDFSFRRRWTSGQNRRRFFPVKQYGER